MPSKNWKNKHFSNYNFFTSEKFLNGKTMKFKLMKSAKNVLPRKNKRVWSIEYFLIRLKYVSPVHEHIDDYSCLMSEFQKSIFKRAQQQKKLAFSDIFETVE